MEITNQKFISNRRLYLDRNREKVIEHNDPAAATLLVCKGGTLPKAIVDQYRLHKYDIKAVKAPVEDKAIKAPSIHKDKGRKR